MAITTVAEWAEAHNVKVTVDEDRGIQTDADGWAHYAYTVTLHVDDRSRSGISWRQGTAYKVWQEPNKANKMQGAWVGIPPKNASSILSALLSDSDGADYSFQEWCADYGYDSDSRKAEATYHACRAIAVWLPRLCGPSYGELIGLERD
jgi:hypothetical protein